VHLETRAVEAVARASGDDAVADGRRATRAAAPLGVGRRRRRGRRGRAGRGGVRRHEPAWRWSAYHSADLQIAAADADAVRRGEFLIVLGDFHGGDNPLAQGLFAHRHPQPGT
jgi:hypothetical protein